MSRTNATGAQVQIFVESLENFPAIWDSNNSLYANRDATRQAWERLSQLVGLAPEDVKKMYATHRKYFSKEYNTRYVGASGDGKLPDNHRGYQYFEQLNFLMPTMKRRQAQSNLESESHSSVTLLERPIRPVSAPPTTTAPSISRQPASTSRQPASTSLQPASTSVQATSTDHQPPSTSHQPASTSRKRKSTEDELQPMKRRAYEVLMEGTKKDDVDCWAMSIAADIKMIPDLMTRKRLMHKLSGLVLEAIGESLGETAAEGMDYRSYMNL